MAIPHAMIRRMTSGVCGTLDSLTEREGRNFYRENFVAKTSKAYKIAFSVAAALCFAVGLPLWLILNSEAAFLFLALGGILALLLPTFLTYRCEIDRVYIRESYFIIFVKVQREIKWRRVRYKDIRVGKSKTLVLYDGRGRRLISFDSSVVGFGHIVRMAKRNWITSYRKRKR